MGKISSYGIDATPSLSDKLIGTDVDNMDTTKNFTIGQIIGLANLGSYVPYTGATGNVNLGAFGITANYFTKQGGTSSQFLKADGSVDSNTYALASSITGLVPYTGATANVNLGANNITANSIIKLGGTSSQFLKADGSVDNTTYLTAGSIEFTQVLNGFSTLSQAPAALNTAVIISFGDGQSNAYVTLEDGGKVQFLQKGAYFINTFVSVERQGSSGGVAVILFRANLNGVQITTTKAIELPSTGVIIPYEVSIPFQANTGDVLWFEIMRDSSGVDAGGLYTHTNLGGWSNVPSSQIQIWKLD
jgi:hypothetical protein